MCQARHGVIPTLWEAKVGRSPEVRSLRPAWSTWWNPVSTKNRKISWAWWQVPVIPASLEAEAGESLEPGRQRLQWAEITPLHFILGHKSETLSQNKKKKIRWNEKRRLQSKKVTILDSVEKGVLDLLLRLRRRSLSPKSLPRSRLLPKFRFLESSFNAHAVAHTCNQS